MITIAIGIIGTITIEMIGATAIETTDTIDSSRFFICSGPGKKLEQGGSDRADVGLKTIQIPGKLIRSLPIGGCA